MFTPQEQKSIADASPNELEEIWFRLYAAYPRLMYVSYHEKFHYWQCLRLPYLLWHSFLSIRILIQVFRELSKVEKDYRLWDVEVPALESLQKKTYVSFHDNYFKIQNKPFEGAIAFSVIDLLEAGASLAEYQGTSPTYPGKSDPKEFSRWRKRNSSYENLFKFVSSKINDERLVLRCLLPLVNTACHTTLPVRAFFELLNAFSDWRRDKSDVSEKFLAQSEPIDWDGIFTMFLNKLDFSTPLNSEMELTNPKFCRLTLSHWLGAGWGTGADAIKHPFINEHGFKWEELAEIDAGFISLIGYPGYMNTQILSYAHKNFDPALSFIKFNMVDGKSKMMSYGKYSAYQWPLSMPDIFTIYGAIKKAANIQFFSEHHLCSFRECPHYIQNYCNSYPVIPDKADSCGFPNRINHLINILS